MYSVTISMRAQDEAGAAILREASLSTVEPSRAEEGCVFFDLLFDDSDPLLVRFYEAYKTKSDFDAHLKSKHVQEWIKIAMPVVDKQSIRMPESVSPQAD